VLSRARRRGRGVTARHVQAENAYARALKALDKRGLNRALGETGRELALRAREARDPGAAPFAELVELYYAARFGGESVAAAELDRLAESVIHPS
jgi:hypothetical protein